MKVIPFRPGNHGLRIHPPEEGNPAASACQLLWGGRPHSGLVPKPPLGASQSCLRRGGGQEMMPFHLFFSKARVPGSEEAITPN